MITSVYVQARVFSALLRRAVRSDFGGGFAVPLVAVFGHVHRHRRAARVEPARHGLEGGVGLAAEHGPNNFADSH